MTEQNVLPADENYSICAMTPGQLDEKGQPLPMCQMVPVTQEVLEIPADDTLQIAEVPGDVVLLETVDVVEAPVTEIVEDSGVISNGGITKMLPEIGTETLVMPPETGTIEEEAGVIIDGSGINETGGALSASEFEPEKPQIEESSGIIDSGSGSKDTVAVVDDSWIDIDSERREAAEQAFFASGNSLCIIDRNPYDKLTPENLYKVRASIVSVTNGNGKRGAGLIVSEQFVLTSADLIVKDNNRYNLETINGGKLKATAFRINPSKNTALLVLDEKPNTRRCRSTSTFPMSAKTVFWLWDCLTSTAALKTAKDIWIMPVPSAAIATPMKKALRLLSILLFRPLPSAVR